MTLFWITIQKRVNYFGLESKKYGNIVLVIEIQCNIMRYFSSMIFLYLFFRLYSKKESTISEHNPKK